MNSDKKIVDIENIRLEYSALKESNSKTIGRRDQILGLALTLASGLFAAAIAHPTIPSIALIYPPIAMFLSIEWSYAYILNILMASYIREHIAIQLPEIGWEFHLKKWRDQHQGRFRIFALHSGVFISSQLIAMVIGLTITPAGQSFELYSYRVLPLLIIDCLCIIVTVVFFIKSSLDKDIIEVCENR